MWQSRFEVWRNIHSCHWNILRLLLRIPEEKITKIRKERKKEKEKKRKETEKRKEKREEKEQIKMDLCFFRAITRRKVVQKKDLSINLFSRLFFKSFQPKKEREREKERKKKTDFNSKMSSHFRSWMSFCDRFFFSTFIKSCFMYNCCTIFHCPNCFSLSFFLSFFLFLFYSFPNLFQLIRHYSKCLQESQIWENRKSRKKKNKEGKRGKKERRKRKDKKEKRYFLPGIGAPMTSSGWITKKMKYLRFKNKRERRKDSCCLVFCFISGEKEETEKKKEKKRKIEKYHSHFREWWM